MKFETTKISLDRYAQILSAHKSTIADIAGVRFHRIEAPEGPAMLLQGDSDAGVMLTLSGVVYHSLERSGAFAAAA